MDEIVLRAVAQRRIVKAARLRDNAAHNGSWDDGGSNAMVREATALLAGLDKRLPEGWEEDAKEVEGSIKHQQDPDYAAAQRFLQRNPDYKR